MKPVFKFLPLSPCGVAILKTHPQLLFFLHLHSETFRVQPVEFELHEPAADWIASVSDRRGRTFSQSQTRRWDLYEIRWERKKNGRARGLAGRWEDTWCEFCREKSSAEAAARTLCTSAVQIAAFHEIYRYHSRNYLFIKKLIVYLIYVYTHVYDADIEKKGVRYCNWKV